MRRFFNARYLLFAMCLLLGFSCRELVTKDFPDYPPEPVINSILIADSLVRVHVSLAQKMDTMPLPVVDNAIVELWEDSLFLERLEHEGEGYYRSATPAKIGVAYKCRVEVPGLPPAEANAHLPQPVEVRNWEHRNFDARDEEGQTYPSAIFTIANIPATPAYFEVCIIQKNYHKVFAPAKLVLFSDPLLLADGLPTGMFSNALVKGDSCRLTLNYETSYSHFQGNFEVPLPYIIEVRSVTMDYYLFVKQLFLYKLTRFPDFGQTRVPAVSLYSNVQNGLGIFAGYSIARSDTIYPPPKPANY